MTAQPHEPGTDTPIDRTFTAVRAALFHPDDVAEFEAEYAELTSRPTVAMAALDEFLTRWWQTAIVANRDRDDWAQVLRLREQLRRGEQVQTRDLADLAAERGYSATR